MNARNLFRGTAIALVVGLSVWQAQVGHRLKAERDEWSAKAATLDDVRDENSRLKQSQIDPDELNRLRKNEAELLRLRGETAQLRQQLKTLRDSQTTVTARGNTPPIPPFEAPDDPVQTFTSTVHAPLAPGQSLIAGGCPALPDSPFTWSALLPPPVADRRCKFHQPILQFPSHAGRLGQFPSAG
jgi:hypothetical protein